MRAEICLCVLSGEEHGGVCRLLSLVLGYFHTVFGHIYVQCMREREESMIFTQQLHVPSMWYSRAQTVPHLPLH